jgi:hypothetical protein
MANPNLTRVHQKIFAGNAITDEIGVFGSLQAGTKLTSSNIATLQSLAAYGLGFSDAATSGEQLPSLEEVNGLHKTETEQIQYILNKGIPEWTADAEYYIGDIQREVGGTKLYKSITDNNIGNALTDALNWEIYYDPDNSIFNNVTINNKLNTQPNAAIISGGAVTYAGAYMVVDTEAAAASDDLDTINGGVEGDILIIRSTDSARDIVIKHAADNIRIVEDVDITLSDTADSITFIYNGNVWIELSRSIKNDFANSKSTNGYTYLPNGLIMQWGFRGALGAFNFPITFPNAVLSIAVCRRSNDGGESLGVSSLSTSGATFQSIEGMSGNYITIGY